MGMLKMLLSCQVQNGQFSNEYAVTLDVHGEELSLFADKYLVETKGGKPYLRVDVMPTSSNPKLKQVLLPSETFESGSRWLSVPQSELQPV